MFLRNIIIFLLVFVTITAGISGVAMCIDPSGGSLELPLFLLKQTHFTNFSMPGLILLVTVAGTSLAALFFFMFRHPFRYMASALAGLMLIGWIVAQVLMIRILFWLQPVYAAIGLFILIGSLIMHKRIKKYEYRDLLTT